MNRLVTSVSRQRLIPALLRGPPGSVQTPLGPPPAHTPTISDVPSTSRNLITPWKLPTAEQSKVKVYRFPTPVKYVVEAPTAVPMSVEKVDPAANIVPIIEPEVPQSPMIAGPRMLTIRRKKMKKHKRRKRYFRDWNKYQTYHRQKKLKAERLFRARMKAIIRELDTFDAEDYVKSTIARAKQEWSLEVAPTGRKKYPHWSELMTVEELFSVGKGDYIDKRAGLPNEEDAAKLAAMRADYVKKYVLVKSGETTETAADASRMKEETGSGDK